MEEEEILNREILGTKRSVRLEETVCVQKAGGESTAIPGTPLSPHNYTLTVSFTLTSSVNSLELLSKLSQLAVYWYTKLAALDKESYPETKLTPQPFSTISSFIAQLLGTPLPKPLCHCHNSTSFLSSILADGSQYLKPSRLESCST